jgi:hypothetical protein
MRLTRLTIACLGLPLVILSSACGGAAQSHREEIADAVDAADAADAVDAVDVVDVVDSTGTTDPGRSEDQKETLDQDVVEQPSELPRVQCDPGETTCSESSAFVCNAEGNGWTDLGPAGCAPGVCHLFKCCTPDCAGKACGDDGCGGTCGECTGEFEKCGDACCGEGEVCGPDAACCLPSCVGKQCGDDGCGGACGTCPPWSECGVDALCTTGCTGDCAGKSCGTDGCGGSCGLCLEDECTDAGQCVPACAPSCLDKECGSDGCGGSCGECPEGQACIEGQCTDFCEPACGVKVCGDDGCGGTCGECEDELLCTFGGWCGGYWAQCPVTTPVPWLIDFSEGNLAHWTASPGASVIHELGSTPALTGGHMLFLLSSTEESPAQSDPPEYETWAALQLCLPPGHHRISMVWRMYSEEFKEWCGSVFQDVVKARLVPAAGNSLTVLSATIDDACPEDQCMPCSGLFGKLEQSDVAFDQGDIWNTPWNEAVLEVDVTPEWGVATLRLSAASVKDAIYKTALLVDRIEVDGKPCVSDCKGKECGSDGCLGLCGQCTEPFVCGPGGLCQCEFAECLGVCCMVPGSVCHNGECCVPECTGKTCGDDGCGGSCGACGEDEKCVNGNCYPGDCLPQCAGKECGPDGCGMTCGTCWPGSSCQSEGTCK